MDSFPLESFYNVFIRPMERLRSQSIPLTLALTQGQCARPVDPVVRALPNTGEAEAIT